MFRNTRTRFGIAQADRLSHLYVIGKTGVGKSSLLELLARGDADAGRGFALLDPHGDLAERVVASLSEAARAKLIYLDAPDRTQPFGYNPLRQVREDLIPLAASGLMETLQKLWPQAWGVRMEHVLRNSLYALLEQPNATLPDILRLYADKTYRRSIVGRLRNPVVRTFWQREFQNYPPRYQAEAVAPIQNKLGGLLADPTLYRILVCPKEAISSRRLMDEGGILVANLGKGRLGEDSASTLGSLLASTLGLAALSRSDLPARDRRPFFIQADEFQTFTTLSFANQMAELRKYGVGLTLAHQHLDQVTPEVRHAVLGNVGSMVVFRVGPEDATHFARELQPASELFDLINLPNRRCFVRLLIDGTPSKPFSARTSPLGQ